MPVQNAEIAAIFDQTADLLEIKGENQFRVRAYRRAARTIEGLPQSVRSMISAPSRSRPRLVFQFYPASSAVPARFCAATSGFRAGAPLAFGSKSQSGRAARIFRLYSSSETMCEMSFLRIAASQILRNW